MILHVGEDVTVSLSDIIAILDMRSFNASAANREYLQIAEGEGRVLDISAGSPESVVVTRDKVVISAVTTSTLRKRAQNWMRLL